MNRSVDAARQSTDDQIRLSPARLKMPSSSRRLFKVEKSRIGMKPLQRRILVVAVNRGVSDALVFEELNEIDGEETFTDTAFAVDE